MTASSDGKMIYNEGTLWFAVIKNNPPFLSKRKIAKGQRKTAYFRRNKLFSGAATQIWTGDLILTNYFLDDVPYRNLSYAYTFYCPQTLAARSLSSILCYYLTYAFAYVFFLLVATLVATRSDAAPSDLIFFREPPRTDRTPSSPSGFRTAGALLMLT